MIRLTQSQIEEKIQQLKGQGVRETAINQYLQKEISSGNLSVSPEPKKDIVRDVAGAIVKPAVDYGKFVGEAGVGVSRLLNDPNYRNAVLKSNMGQELSPEEAQAVLSKPATQFLDEEKVADRGKILETGAKATAGAASYAVPFGASSKALLGAGALTGGLQAFSQDENVTQGTLLGGAGGLVLGKLAPKLFGAMKGKGVSAPKTGKYIKPTFGEKTYLSNFVIPTKRAKDLRPRETAKAMLDYQITGSLDDIGNKAALASGENGLITRVQRNAISRIGKEVDTGSVFNNINKSLDQVIDLTPPQRNQIIKNIQNTVPIGKNIGSANALDVFDSIKTLEQTGHQYLNTSTYLTGNIRNEMIGQIYLDVAKSLEDSLVRSAKQGVVIQDLITPEILAEANQISPKLAQQLRSAKTIRDLRELQAPFVRIQKMIDLTQQSELSAFQNLAGSLKGVAGAIPTLKNPLAPLSAVLSDTGVSTNIAQKLQNLGEGATQQASIGKFSLPTSPAGARVGMITSPAVGEQMLSGTPSEAITPAQEQSSAIPATPSSVDIFGGHSKQEVLNAALQSGAKLKELEEIEKVYDLVGGGDTDTELTTDQKKKLGALSSSEGIITTIEDAFSELNVSTSGVGARISGIGKGLGAKIGTDTKAATYKSIREGSASLLLKALGEAGTLSDKDIARATNLLPDLGDSKQEAEVKLQRLRQIIELSRQGVFDAANAGQE